MLDRLGGELGASTASSACLVSHNDLSNSSLEHLPLVGRVGCATIMQFGGHNCQLPKPVMLRGSLDTSSDCVAKIFF